tara:strand:+ start:622 stop:906 length:285 start_codon:yes stop_codon:yes gene_type:complete
MCRTNKDIKVEYENSMELKRLRQVYVMHVLDFVCQERQRIFNNDMKALAVRDKDRVTLDNVFELANKKDGKNKGMRKLDDLEDENKDEKQIDDK